jgi:hypothetical protein
MSTTAILSAGTSFTPEGDIILILPGAGAEIPRVERLRDGPISSRPARPAPGLVIWREAIVGAEARVGGLALSSTRGAANPTPRAAARKGDPAPWVGLGSEHVADVVERRWRVRM